MPETRRHVEGRPSDYRRSYARDNDRVLYSSAFRRLNGVTQVVSVDETQLFHNRLTHSLKVAQVALRMAEKLQEESTNLGRFGGLDPTATEAAARAHDLGHPPFGHVAEKALMACCDAEGLDGYEGNAQSFRLVTRLAVGSGKHPGLNLTRRTLRAILKYPWLRADPSATEAERKIGDYDARKKWGAYVTEAADFEFAMDHGIAGQRSLEAQIMDLADDVTYAVHDLEDFYRAGLTPIARLQQDAEERSRFIARATADLTRYAMFDAEEAANSFNELMVNVLEIPRPYAGTNKDRLALHKTSSVLITRFIDSVGIDATGNLSVDRPIWHEINMLKQLTWQYVIASPDLATIQEGQKHIIRSLFETLKTWMSDEDRDGRLPTRLRELVRKTDAESDHHYGGSDERKAARAIADYISSLTEAQAIELHGRLLGVSRSSVLNGWVRMH